MEVLEGVPKRAGGYNTEGETVRCLEMTDGRNMTSHTYKEEVSQILYEKMPDYCSLMENLMGRIVIWMDNTITPIPKGNKDINRELNEKLQD